MELNLFHMYPEQLNLYGDTGNIQCLVNRCKQRNIKVNLYKFSKEEKYDLSIGDIFFIGGGSDYSQEIVYNDFLKYKDTFKEIIEDNKVLLAVCGGYQLLGKEYITKEGNALPGLNIFDYTSVHGNNRIIGNIVLETTLPITPKTVVGFENHGGRTYSKYTPLGKVLAGKGNNDTDLVEGVIYKNYIGTYLHGPILPKNPHIADYLILKALQNKYDISELEKLDDTIEYKAHNKFLKLYNK